MKVAFGLTAPRDASDLRSLGCQSSYARRSMLRPCAPEALVDFSPGRGEAADQRHGEIRSASPHARNPTAKHRCVRRMAAEHGKSRLQVQLSSSLYQQLCRTADGPPSSTCAPLPNDRRCRPANRSDVAATNELKREPYTGRPVDLLSEY